MTEQFEPRLRAYLAAAAEPLPDLAERSLERALRPTALNRLRAVLGPRGRSLGYAFAGGALLLAAIAGGTDLYRLSHGGQAPAGSVVPSPASSAATPSPTPPARDHGGAPQGTNLIWVVDPADPSFLQAVDWSGRFVGTIRLDRSATDPAGHVVESLLQDPDGQRLALRLASGPLALIDAADHSLGSEPAAAATGEHGNLVWAPDGSGLCGMRNGYDLGASPAPNPPFAQVLEMLIPGPGKVMLSPSKRIRDVTRFDEPVVGQVSYDVAACAPASDRAVVVRTAIYWPTDLYVVRVSTGATVFHRTYSSGYLADVVASPDGAMVAENAGPSPLQGPRPAPATYLRRTSDGRLLATLPAADEVVAFSGDGALVLVRPSLTASGAGAGIRAIDWRTGRTAWTFPTTEQLAGALAQPGGRGFALELQNPIVPCPTPGVQQPGCGDDTIDRDFDLHLVDSQGREISVPGRYPLVH